MFSALMSHASENLLVNANFEQGNVGFETTYRYSPRDITNVGDYDIVKNPINSHSGAGSFEDHTNGEGLMLALNGSSDPEAVLWRQSISVASNKVYTFSAWLSTFGELNGVDPNPPTFQAFINGTLIGTYQVLPQTGLWQKAEWNWFSQENTNAVISLKLESTVGFGNDPVLDDLFFGLVDPVTSIRVSEVEICWFGISGHTYQVQFRSNFSTNQWLPLGGPVMGNNRTSCIADRVTASRRYYRVIELP